MSKYHITMCPACGKGKLKSVRWSNGSSCEPDKYLDQDLFLTCAGCDNKELIFNLYFKCENHDEFRKITNGFIFYVSLSKGSSIPEDILTKMIQKLDEYEDFKLI